MRNFIAGAMALLASGVYVDFVNVCAYGDGASSGDPDYADNVDDVDEGHDKVSTTCIPLVVPVAYHQADTLPALGLRFVYTWFMLGLRLVSAQL